MHTKKQKKHTPLKAAAIRLTLLLFPMCTKLRAVTKIPSRQTNATDREQYRSQPDIWSCKCKFK